MGISTLPVRGDIAYYDFDLAVGGVNYTFQFRWNDRAEAWFMSVYDQAGDPIIAGVKVILGAFMARYKDARLFDGLLNGMDLSRTFTMPAFGAKDLGERVVVNLFEFD